MGTMRRTRIMIVMIKLAKPVIFPREWYISDSVDF
jgi:hypothetical protein